MQGGWGLAGGPPCTSQPSSSPRPPARLPCQPRRPGRWRGRPAASSSSSGPPSDAAEASLRVKLREVRGQILELGEEVVEQQMEDAMATPITPQFQLAHLALERHTVTGQPIVILEIGRPKGEQSTAEVVRLAQELAEAKPDALLLSNRRDWAPPSSWFGTLVAVCRAVRLPVIASDVFVHPIQIVDAKTAGAVAVVGIQMLGGALKASYLTAFAFAAGLDAPIEVTKASEVAELNSAGQPAFCLNIALDSVAAHTIPGYRQDLVKSTVAAIPPDSLVIAGVRTLGEAADVAGRGVTAVYVAAPSQRRMREEGGFDSPGALLEALRYAVSGDD